MSIYARYHWTSHAAVLVGMLLFAVADQVAVMAIVAIGATALSAIMFRSTIDSPVPKLVRWGLVAAAVITLLLSLPGQLEDVVSVVGQFLIWLHVIKLLDDRTARDQGQLLTLSLMLVIGGVLTAVTLPIGVLLILYAPLMLASLIQYQLFAGEVEQARAARRAERRTGDAPPESKLPRGGRAWTNTLVAAATVSIVLSALGTFLVIPRSIGQGAFGDWGQPRSGAVTGLSDQVQLGGQGNITENRSIVLEAAILDDAQRNLPAPAGSTRYLRAHALDEYDLRSGTWRRSTHASTFLTDGSFVEDHKSPESFSNPPPGVTEGEARIRFRNRTSEYLVAPWRVTQVAVDRGSPRVSPVDAAVRMRDNQGPMEYAVRFQPDRARAVIRYDDANRERRIAYTPPLGAGPPVRFGRRPGDFEPDLPPPSAYWRWSTTPRRDLPDRDVPLDPFLHNPENIESIERIRELARSVLADAGLQRDPDLVATPADDAIVSVFEQWLSTNCFYTLERTAPMPGEDPIEMFLFRTQRGHCEYFAAALAAMCRSVGINARMVAGYVATEFDPLTEVFLVRESHAHAWVEAPIAQNLPEAFDPADPPDELPTFVWRTYDPSPRDALAQYHQPGQGLMARLVLLVDRIEALWATSIVTYDAERQQRVFNADDGGPFGLFDWARERLARSPDRDRPRSPLGFVLRTIGIFFVIFTALSVVALGVRTIALRLRIGGRRRATITEEQRRIAQQTVFYRDALRLLDDAGLGKPEHTPPVAHARWLDLRDPALGDALRRIATLYYTVRFRGITLSDRDAQRAQAAVDDLRERLANLRPIAEPTP